MKIWVLTDSKIDSSKQAVALAKELSDDVVIKNVYYNKFIVIPNCLKTKLCGIDKAKSDDVFNDKDYPSIIVFAGRRLAGLALYLKKKIAGVKLISIFKPDYPLKKFDHVLLPKKNNLKPQNNTIEVISSLCKIDTNNLESDVKYWSKALKDKTTNLFTPYIALMVGGDTSGSNYDPEKFGQTMLHISNLVNKSKSSLLVATTYKTTKDYIDEMTKNLNCPYYLYNWKEERNREDRPDPFQAFLELSDIVMATGDLIPTISEAVTYGKPCYVYKPHNSLTKNHINFLTTLEKKNLIRDLSIATKSLTKYSYKPLNELERVADLIKKQLNNN